MMANNRSSRTCHSVGRVTARLLLSFLALSPTSSVVAGQGLGRADVLPQIPLPPAGESPSDGLGVGQGALEGTHTFTLRHIFHHGTHKHPTLHRRLDVHPETKLFVTLDGSERAPATPLVARSRAMNIQRLSDRRPSNVEPLLAAAKGNGAAIALSSSAWTLDELPGPNVTDKETIISLARMAANAYVILPGTGEWEDVGGGFNETEDFGWLGDGLRGHIFADETNSTVVIGLKGTSVAVFDGAETTTNDKVNDNLFFGCCCGQGGNVLWKQVCDCYTTTYTCNQTCVRKALLSENRYYRASLDLYKNVTSLYKTSNVWVAGHSLGGSVSSLLGLTYGLPTVTYQAPGEALAATRIGLFSPPGTDPDAPQTRKYTGAFHIGHNADPIFMGTCNGVTSACTLGGYAMETACHTGQRCVYNVVEDKGWRVSATTHRIHSVINDVIIPYDTVPACQFDTECRDCANWDFFESNGTETTTSKATTSSTAKKTRTSTCKTPGWWGCLDESTTGTATPTTITSKTTITTTSCRTPGWFGCKDPVTSTTTSTTTIVTPAPTTSTRTSTCTHPGYFGGCNDIPETTTTTAVPTSALTRTCESPGFWGGCNDKKTTPHTITSAPSTAPIQPSATTTRHSCTSREWFGLICVDPSPTSGTNPTETDPSKHKAQEKCVQRTWYGRCKKWAQEDDTTAGSIEEWKKEI